MIDAHQHFWDLDRVEFDYGWLESAAHQPIRKSFLPADLEPLIAEVGVTRSVIVQTQHNVAGKRLGVGLSERKRQDRWRRWLGRPSEQ